MSQITNFPNTIQQYPAKGVQGDKATLNPFVYTDRNYIAGDDGVTVGHFVWDDPTNPVNNPDDYHGSGIFKALSTGTAGVQPVGIVERNLSYILWDLTVGASLVVPKGSALNTVKYGDMYVVATTAATKGQKLFAVIADGTIQTGAAGGTVSGAVETPWVVVDGGPADSLITVSSWFTPPTAP